jgi:hypothetical protein
VRKALAAVVVMALLLVAAPAALAASVGLYSPAVRTVELEMPRDDAQGLTSWNVFGVSDKPSLGPEFDVTLTGVGGGIRYYLDGVDRGGVYLGGYAGLYWMSGKYSGSDTLARAVVLTAASGYKWKFSDFFIDMGARLSFPLSADTSSSYDAAAAFHEALGTQVQFGFGISF